MNTYLRLLGTALLGLLAMPVAAVVYSVEAGDTQGLIRAIESANQTPGAHLIDLQRGVYLLRQAYADSNNGLPVVVGQVRLMGNGAELRRYAQDDFRILEVAPGAHVRVDGLVIAEGSFGALSNHGRLECRRCLFLDHTDQRHRAIVENFGELQLTSSEVSFNTLVNAARDAGTIVNFGTVRLERSRLQGNRLSRRVSSLSLATAVLNYGVAELEDVRILENEVQWSAGVTQAEVGGVLNLGNGRSRLLRIEHSDEAAIASLP